jgi:hypothetical protein
MPATLLPPFLLDEIEARESGVGAAIPIPQDLPPVNVTLGITRVLQQECLDVSVWGDNDTGVWIRLASFPNKCYCGTYTMPLNLADNPHISRLRVEWKMTRWNQSGEAPLFGFYVSLDEQRARRAGAS